MELIIGIVHLIHLEHRLQASLVKGESCEPPMATPQSLAESQPIPLEIPWRSWYPPWLVHVPLYSNRNNTQALA